MMIKLMLLIYLMAPSAMATVILDDSYLKITRDILASENVKIIFDKKEKSSIEDDKMLISLVAINNKKRNTILNLQIYIDEIGFVGANEKIACQENQIYQFKILLSSKLFKVNNHKNKIYYIQDEIACSNKLELSINSKSLHGGALEIWNLATTITKKLERYELLSFWKKKLKIIYPARGDYYNYKGVHVTKGHHWDVVGHEIGHAVYKMAKIGSFGFGQHKIDECYTDSLALSEGWASFFSAWVSLDLHSKNAMFEYMVPRRAPLGVEHIPLDVCYGQKNEWRVFGFLWDLIDYNNDNQHFSMGIKELWRLFQLKKLRNIGQLKEAIQSSGHDPILINLLWNYNFFDN